MSWRETWHRWRLERQARRLLAELFAQPERLRGTSLKSRHGNRWVLIRVESGATGPERINFGILRHPRPYTFSKQSHKVIEHYCYDVLSGEICRELGHNVTRERGGDAD